MGLSSDDNKGINVLPPEAFTGHPDPSAYTEHPYNLKAEDDRIMILGINRFFFYHFVHQPVDEAFPGITFGLFGVHFDRKSTCTAQASGWSEYIGRISSLMQSSVRVTEVVCFYSEEPLSSAIIAYNTPYLVPLPF